MTVSTVLGTLVAALGAALLTVGLLGWLGRLPRNRFAGVRTFATLRCDAAFGTANRVAAPPTLAAGTICVIAGAFAFVSTGSTLVVVLAVGAVGAVTLAVVGGLLGHRAALMTISSRPSRCAGCPGADQPQ